MLQSSAKLNAYGSKDVETEKQLDVTVERWPHEASVTEEINKLDKCALSWPCIDFQILYLTLS